MAEAKLTKTKVRAGVWEGLLTAEGGAPALEVLHLEQKLPGLSVTEVPGQPGHYAVRLPIPASVLTEGVQTFLFRDAITGDKLGHFTIITGVAMEDDLRAEVDLLRAELDMLKRAFRRHCLETTG
ncbi:MULTISPECIES: hypothetical protein [Gemmobacter]|jgi:hypothetical protein|uniref:Uncharacterized protein n=2 Tax=Gemmobacter TaxID=204456 RepID=A0A2T6B221_9RHOB|nr:MULTISPECIES: hypothetical protein [Gemmobacter]OJY31764.1 MAG: hypothetical protein BGP11_09265 [Rhodobacterales bacterium 65-51]PTX50082.1 hypothetical protein C8N34_106264 [Gemmobacter caeni]TWJ01977.1 hypothetical protein IQ03_01629 [Gemmobacter caeni]GHC21347.1 hypothetical protein GCM10007291_20520 [Gemmobacter nanjingensis]